jgi:hypothetical protein
MFKAVLGAVCRHGVPLDGCFAFTPRGGAVGEKCGPNFLCLPVLSEVWEPYRDFVRDLLEFYLVENVRVRIDGLIDVYPLPSNTLTSPTFTTPTTHTTPTRS